MARTIVKYLRDPVTGKVLSGVSGEAFRTDTDASIGTGISDANGLLSITTSVNVPIRLVAYVPGRNQFFDERDVDNSTFIAGPSPWADVKAYGADATGAADSATAIGNAITAVSA